MASYKISNNKKKNSQKLQQDTALRSRIFLTIFLLVIYRVCSFIPMPGIDVTLLEEMFSGSMESVLGMVNLFSGGSLKRMSIFALGIMPYITASIVMQLMAVVSKTIAALKKEGDYGRKKMNQYTRYLTLLLAIVQAIGVYYTLANNQSQIFYNNEQSFLVSTVVTIVGGTMILMWFGEKITASGIGNGISLIIFVGIVSEMPAHFAQVFDLARTGVYSGFFVVGFLLFFVALLGGIAFFEKAQRQIKVQYATSKGYIPGVGNNPNSSFLPLKINISGVIPPIFASSLIMFPYTIMQFSSDQSGPVMVFINNYLHHGSLLYMLIFTALIVFFSFFYTAVVFNTTETADRLKKGNSFIAGVRPGAATATYLDGVVTRLTVIGSLYLVVICVMPEFLVGYFSLPFYLGGTGMLIIVNVIMDTVAQFQSHNSQNKYGGMTQRRRIKVRA